MSKIEVNKIGPQCGTTLTVGCGAGQTVVADAATVTLGRCGGTVALASGATQTGFGRTGTVDWDTTPKTATFSAVSGDGFFANTSGGAFTMNLPAGSAGAIVSVADYAGTWQTNALTVSPNGTDKLGGVNASTDLSEEGQSVTFVFVDSTQGWINTMDSTSNVRATNFVAATGGTVLTNGNFKTHIFTGPGTFQVTAGGAPGGSNAVDYLVLAGGGAGGTASYGGGGGAGGFRIANSAGCIPAPTMSPLVAPASLPVSVQSYPITVGGGGSAPAPNTANAGSNSIFSTLTAAGGGRGEVAPANSGPLPAAQGGSGGGGQADAALNNGSGNTPPVSPPQGNNGGASQSAPYQFGGGGGGAGAAGNAGNSSGTGGVGSFIADSFIGPTAPSYGTPGPVSSTRYFAGGGGGGSNANVPYPGTPGTGQNGGGNGGVPGYTGQSGYIPNGQAGTSATANTGSGGGGSGYGPSPNNIQGAGGSGIVIIRYKFQ
jgi:hypothetical protein